VRGSNPRHVRSVEVVSVGALIVILVAGVVKPWIAVSNNAWLVLFIVAALGQGIRLLLWQPFRARGNPLLWMLPIAYAWLPISLVFRALGVLNIVPVSTSFHALTIGAITSLMIAMMMRSALGHTGRPLAAGRTEIITFVLLQIAAVVRVLASSVVAISYRDAMIVSGSLWTLAFVVFLFRYWPILTQPRVDGRPG